MCEGHDYGPAECADITCCEYSGGKCTSKVGDDACDTTDRQTDDGVSVCEGHSFSEDECAAIDCCEFYDSQCWSKVGTDACNSVSSSDDDTATST